MGKKPTSRRASYKFADQENLMGASSALFHDPESQKVFGETVEKYASDFFKTFGRYPPLAVQFQVAWTVACMDDLGIGH